MSPEANTSNGTQEPCMKAEQPNWTFEGTIPEPVHIRGGGCLTSAPGDEDGVSKETSHQGPIEAFLESQPAELTPHASSLQKAETNRHLSWPGWAELENDPEIFTILLQEWGMLNVQVNEVYDITDLLDTDPSSILGLIFLSRYVAVNPSRAISPAKDTDLAPKQPWFANQISKFSCGTVALMNILMNIQNADANLSKSLSSFRTSTIDMDAKHKGIALDSHAQFRDIHNSFSTRLDRYIVDTLLKEEFDRAKRQYQARNANKKRKRGGRGFTKRRKPKENLEDEDENGFHFVAYVSADENVWRLDGMQAAPTHVGSIEEGQTWLNVTVQDILPLLQEALSADQQCTMMSVSMSEGTAIISNEEKTKKQEDWAPFIETLIRIHAERGDLNTMLGF